DKLADEAVTTAKIEKGESGSVLVTDKDGTVKWVKEDSSLIKDLVKVNETLTVLSYDQSKNALTYKDEKGAEKEVVLGTGAITYDKATNTLTYTDAKGVATTLPLNKTSLTYNDADQKLVYVDSEGKAQTIDLNKLAKGKVTSTTIVINKGEASEGSTFKNIDLEVAPGTNGQVMVTKEGKATWVAQSEIVPTTTNVISTEGDKLVSTVNDVKSELTLAGDVTLKGGKTVVNAIQNTPVSETKPTTPGQALIFKDGQWVPGTPNVTVDKVTDAKTLSTDGVIVIGADSNATATTAVKTLLADVRLNIAKDKITTEHIANGTIKPEDIAKAGNNQVLVTDSSGVPAWKNQTEVGEVITADNGLTKTKTNVQLGGVLTKVTAINTTTTNTLAVTGLQPAANTDYVVMADAQGVLKQMKAAMPKFFYMPSVVMPTAVDQISAEVTPNVTHSNGTYTIDLYANYTSQFGTPKVTSQTNFKLPVLPANELIYNITWFDPTVFTNVAVTAEGKLTYRIAANADVTIGSFMNIVFAVK
ncbi:MAG: hypothetical protein ACRCVU_02340, partial [Flavobacterium sp.]